jgi:hypothetical protein
MQTRRKGGTHVVTLLSCCSLLLPSPDFSDSSTSEVTLFLVSVSMLVPLSEVEVSDSEALLEDAGSGLGVGASCGVVATGEYLVLPDSGVGAVPQTRACLGVGTSRGRS